MYFYSIQIPVLAWAPSEEKSRCLQEMTILRQVEIVVIFMPIFFAESMLTFGRYEMKSSEATPFRGSILMRCRLYIVPLHDPQLVFLICCEMMILRKVEILVRFMPSLVALKVATVMEPMFTAKINYSPSFKFQNLTIPSTSRLLLS